MQMTSKYVVRSSPSSEYEECRLKLYWDIISHLPHGQKFEVWQHTLLIKLLENKFSHKLLVEIKKVSSHGGEFGLSSKITDSSNLWHRNPISRNLSQTINWLKIPSDILQKCPLQINVIAKEWKQFRCPKIKNWLNKLIKIICLEFFESLRPK